MKDRTPRRPAWLALTLLCAGALLSSCLQHFEPAPPAPQPEQHELTLEPHRVEIKPSQIVEAQAGGQMRQGQWWFGYTPNPQATQAFLRTLPRPYLRQAGPDLLRNLTGDQPVLLYKALYEAHAAQSGGGSWRVGQQGIGDCVSWGWAHGADIHLAVKWKLGESSEWRPAATEAIYGGSRVEARCGNDSACKGGWSDGSYGGAAAKWCKQTGGIIFRQPYEGFDYFDLSTYSSSLAKQWGNYGCGGKGDNGRLDQIAKQHPLDVALVQSFEEAAAAIASGYPVPVCSGRGFGSQRDQDGFCRPSGSWSHCMCFIGVRFDRKGLLCLNSWGPSWVNGPKWPQDQPDGSFWVDADVADAMLRGGDSFAVSGYHGFPYRDLKHGEWVNVSPARKPAYGPQLVSRWPGSSNMMHLSLAP